MDDWLLFQLRESEPNPVFVGSEPQKRWAHSGDVLETSLYGIILMSRAS